MRIVKLVSLGLGAAFLSLTAASSAGPQMNLSSVSGESPTVIVGEYVSFTVKGTGKCHVGSRYVDPKGVTHVDSYDGTFAKDLPTSVNVKPTMPGEHKVTVFTIAAADTPGCPAGQELTSSFTAIAAPKCPTGWTTVGSVNRFTGAISCVPKKPQITCAGKTQAFFTPTAQVCAAGCEAVPE